MLLQKEDGFSLGINCPTTKPVNCVVWWLTVPYWLGPSLSSTTSLYGLGKFLNLLVPQFPKQQNGVQQ